MTCVCILALLSGMQSACAVMYCRLWPVRLYHTLPHYLIIETILPGGGLNTQRVFRFSLRLLSEIFLILRIIRENIIIYLHGSSCNQLGGAGGTYGRQEMCIQGFGGKT
jgi:hypothetical protein